MCLSFQYCGRKDVFDLRRGPLVDQAMSGRVRCDGALQGFLAILNVCRIAKTWPAATATRRVDIMKHCSGQRGYSYVHLPPEAVWHHDELCVLAAAGATTVLTKARIQSHRSWFSNARSGVYAASNVMCVGAEDGSEFGTPPAFPWWPEIRYEERIYRSSTSLPGHLSIVVDPGAYQSCRRVMGSEASYGSLGMGEDHSGL